MNSNFLGLIIGGVVAALFYGLTNVFAKISTLAGLSASLYLIFAAIGLAAVGWISYFFFGGDILSLRAVSSAVAAGAAWGIGTICVVVAIQHYASDISQIVPLHGLGILISVLLGFYLFSEWKDVNTIQLTLGAIIIILGCVLVVRA